MSRNTRNFLITLVVIIGMIASTQLILKDYLYYRRVMKEQDIESCERYLNTFPEGFYHQKVGSLLDTYRYEEAQALNTPEAYDDYLQAFGDLGKHAAEARAKAEALHYQALSERADLEEIIRFLRRFPETEYRSALEKQEEVLWKTHQRSFMTYAEAQGMSPMFTRAMLDLFDYMQAHRYTTLYLSTHLNKDSVKDWNDYPAEIRFIWDKSLNLRQRAFDRALLAREWAQLPEEASISLPRDLREPSNNPPRPLKRNLSQNDITRIMSEHPVALKKMLTQASEFPRVQVVRKKREIPQDAPALVLACTPTNQEITLDETQVPRIYMRLRKHSDASPQEDATQRLSFNGYFMAIDVTWEWNLLKGDAAPETLFRRTYRPELLTHFFDKSQVRQEYSRIVKTTYEQFIEDTNEQLQLNLATEN